MGKRIRKPAVRQLLGGISETTLWRIIQEFEDFPKSFRLTKGLCVWEESEVLAWIESRKESSAAFPAVNKTKATVGA